MRLGLSLTSKPSPSEEELRQCRGEQPAELFSSIFISKKGVRKYEQVPIECCIAQLTLLAHFDIDRWIEISPPIMSDTLAVVLPY